LNGPKRYERNQAQVVRICERRVAVVEDLLLDSAHEIVEILGNGLDVRRVDREVLFSILRERSALQFDRTELSCVIRAIPVERANLNALVGQALQTHMWS
jgi:hypothetical protein